MLTLESIVKYKNFKILETRAITPCELKQKMNVNKARLDICYYILYALFAIFVVGFVALYALCVTSECSFIKGSYVMPLELAIANIVVWIVLSICTFSFVSMLNKRFGSDEFRGPKCKLLCFLSLFSLSFFVRGTWDLVLYHWPIEFANEQDMAAVIFVVYFTTEWLPIFAIYLTHLWAFYSIHKQQKMRARGSESTENGMINNSPSPLE